MSLMARSCERGATHVVRRRAMARVWYGTKRRRGTEHMPLMLMGERSQAMPRAQIDSTSPAVSPWRPAKHSRSEDVEPGDGRPGHWLALGVGGGGGRHRPLVHHVV